MTRYVAKFSDGFVAEIANSKREYTHAWTATGMYTPEAVATNKIAPPHEWRMRGFAGSARLAESNMASELRYRTRAGRWNQYKPTGTLEFSEIVAVEHQP